MALVHLIEACKEFVKDPDAFGYEAMAELVHGFADNSDNSELLDFAKLILGITE